MKKILVIDGNSIINRAYYGIRPLTTKSGKYTNAIFGMINIITKQLSLLKPDYCAVAFDIKHPTFRHEMYEGYKAGRHPTPPELLSQFDDAKECLKLMGIKVLELPGWEADDIQGTIAKMAYTADGDTESYVLSGDRDLLQLIDDKITVLLATNTDTLRMGREEFKTKYGIEPEQFVDLKALMGDSSDNIPGVSGVGEKTATSLISAFGSLDGIYDNIDDKRISKGVREKLLKDKDNAYLSKKLAKIDTNAPVDVELCDIAYQGFDKGGMYKKFTELELVSFIQKFGLEPDRDADCNDVYTVSFAEACCEDLLNEKAQRIAVEHSISGELYIYVNGKNIKYSGNIADISDFLKKKEIICYDGKALWHLLDGNGVDCSDITFLDLMLYEYVINPGSKSIGSSGIGSSFLGITTDASTKCPEILYRAEPIMKKTVEEAGGLDVLEKLELPLIKVLAETEKNGFKINPRGILEFSEALGELAEDLASRIYMQAGEVFNLNSPKQLGEVLYEKMGLSGGKKTKTGYSTDAKALEAMRPFSPIIDDILEYRQVTKLKGTYTTALTDVKDENDRIHTDFKQAITATGRLSSAEPNLQNIPVRTKMGRQMRDYFIAEDGYSLVDADYSQIELRLLAHISGDYNMTEAYLEGSDIHTKCASAVFGVPEEQVNSEMRKRAKAVNFGIVYGISAYSLSEDIGTSVSEASKYIKNYFMNYPSIEEYLENVVKDATANGYTTTIFGRRRYIPELKAQNGNLRAFGKRVAMNAPIQGTAADIMKLAMINVHNRLKKEKLDARLVMQVHDELIVEARDEIVDRVKLILKEEMENVCRLSVPLTVEVSSGKTWLEQK